MGRPLYKNIIRALLWLVGIIVLLVVAFAIAYVVIQPKEVASTDTPVGIQEHSFVDSTRDRTLNAYVWYPTAASGNAQLFDSNPVFFGFSAVKDAPLPTTAHPLVVLSHGSGGNKANQGWLAVELAKLGAVVVAANHPGSTSRDSAPATNILAWNRPLDIQFLLDALIQNESLAPIIDSEKISAIGHSLGGYAVLAAAGAQLSMDEFQRYCTEFPANPDCLFYKAGGVDLNAVDKTKFSANYKDERIKGVVSIDPAYARSFQASSVQSLPPTLLLSPVAKPGSIDDLQVDHLYSQFTNDTQHIKMEGVHHFTFMPRCKPMGKPILSIVEKGANVLCAAERGTTRQDAHALAVKNVTQFLQQHNLL